MSTEKSFLETEINALQEEIKNLEKQKNDKIAEAQTFVNQVEGAIAAYKAQINKFSANLAKLGQENLSTEEHEAANESDPQE